MLSKNLKNRLIKDKVEPYVYLLPFMLFLIVFTIYPVINVFILSFNSFSNNTISLFENFFNS